MDDEGLNGLPSSGNSGFRGEKSITEYGYSGIDSQPSSSKHKEDITSKECVERKGGVDLDNTDCISGANFLKGDDGDNNSKMKTEEMVCLPVSSNYCCKFENYEACGAENSKPSDFVDKEKNLENEKLSHTDDYIQLEGGDYLPETDPGNNLAGNQSTWQVNFELKETVTVAEEGNSWLHTENGGLFLVDGSHKIDGCSKSGVKRARITVDEHQPSVHVVYDSLTRASKQKLEELLLQWSEWHAQHVSLSKDPSEVLESGEETFFPSLHVGLEKTSSVSFWMDNQTRKEQNRGFTPLEGNSVPLYDRGYALGLASGDGSNSAKSGLEIIDDAARCFNCGSYNHSLRECPRPRDNVAVNIARKQHKSRRNQNTGSRNSTRYYQNSPAGKYDGLRPGALDAETRQLLGLGELDPPPWLDRMREMGYPPGYLDVDDEDQPSGITIYADGEIIDQEDGEVIKADSSKTKRKMTVEFPGVNAPIPENADKRLWAAGSSGSDIFRNRPQQRLNQSTDYVSRGYYREQRFRDLRDDGPPGDPGYYFEQRFRDLRDDGPPGDLGYYREQRFRDLRDDGPPGDAGYYLEQRFRGLRDDGPPGDPGYYPEQRFRDLRDDGPPGDPGYYHEQRFRDLRDDGPPGDPGYSSSMFSFHLRYGGYDFKSSPHYLDRSMGSPLHDEGFLEPTAYSSYYSPPERLLWPLDSDPGRFEYWSAEREREGRHYGSWR